MQTVFLELLTLCKTVAGIFLFFTSCAAIFHDGQENYSFQYRGWKICISVSFSISSQSCYYIMHLIALFRCLLLLELLWI